MTREGFGVLEFVIGLGIGVVAGVLLAPQSGEESRREVRRRTNDGLDYLNQQKVRVRQRADQVLAKTKDWARRRDDQPVASETALQQAYQESGPEG